MVKVIFCLRRRPGQTVDEFQRYWLDTHGPLVRSNAAALGIQRYVQVHTLESDANDLLRQGRGGPPPYDGVAELWWNEEQDLADALATQEGRAAGRTLLQDERTFLDLAHSPIWIAREHEVVAGR